MIKRFFVLMIISCMLLVGCNSTTEKSTTEKNTAAPKCDICHMSDTCYDWKLVSIIFTSKGKLYCYECKYCGNVVEVKKPIIRDLFQK